LATNTTATSLNLNSVSSLLHLQRKVKEVNQLRHVSLSSRNNSRTAGWALLKPDFLFSCGSTAQFWALAASMKLSASFQFLDLGRSAGLLGWMISSSQGLCQLPRVIVMMRSWWNERFWQGKPKCSAKTCPHATLSTTNLIARPGREPGPPR
jgi:hypothetical protein